MLNKLIATFCAWALAPLSMLFLTYLPLYIIFYSFTGYSQGTGDIIIMGSFLSVSYVVTAVVGLLTHAALLTWRKDRTRNYTLVGFTAVVLWFVLVLITDGFPKNGIDSWHINWFLFLSLHGIVVATSFSVIYKKVYGLITRPKTTMGANA